jgi:hypothetical protein
MSKKSILQNILIGLIFICAASATLAQTTAFSYQGLLNNGGAAANGNFEFQFKLFDAPSGGTQVGNTFSAPTVAVINGVFTTVLDFGALAFNDGSARFLEIALRPAGSTNPFTILAPRTQILSALYAIQAKNAQTANTSLNAQQLGGLDAGAYVTTTSVGNSFIKNGTALQTANFNISGNGSIGGNLGIGTTAPTSRLEVNGSTLLTPGGFGGTILFHTPGAETGFTISGTNRADVRFDGTTLKMLAGAGTGLVASTNGINVNTSGNVGIGTTAPNTRLTLSGGAPWTINGWTASLNLQNGAALGWEANASGQRFGIGQSTGALYFFRTNSAFGNTASPANYDFGISDSGNLLQPQDKGGLVKAMIYVNQNGTIARCFNGQNNTSSGGCGFAVSNPAVGTYDINFGFQVDNRFIATAINNLGGPGCDGGNATINAPVGNTVRVRTICTDYFNKPFMIFVY